MKLKDNLHIWEISIYHAKPQDNNMQFSDDDNGIKKIIIVLHAQILPSNLVLNYSLLRKLQQNKKTADVYDVFPHDKY